MKRPFACFVGFGLIVFAASLAAAQAQPPAGGAGRGGQQPPPPLTNLKIYPKDIARPELITTMQGFVRQLGVQSQGGCGRSCCRRGLRGGRSNRTGSRRLLLRQVGNCHFHRAIDRDSGNAFVLIDPCVRREFLLAFFVQRLQLFHALFCARFFVITCARRRPDQREHDETEQSKETYNTEPCGEWRTRVGNAAS